MTLNCKVNGNNQSHSRLDDRSNSPCRARGESPTPLLNLLGSLASSPEFQSLAASVWITDEDMVREKRCRAMVMQRHGHTEDGCLLLASYIVFLKASCLSLGFGDTRFEVHLFPLTVMRGRAAVGKQPVPNAFQVSESQR